METKFFENEIYADRASHAERTPHISIILGFVMFGTADLLQFEWSVTQKLRLVYTAQRTVPRESSGRV